MRAIGCQGAVLAAAGLAFAGCAPKDKNLPNMQALWRAAQERKSQPLPTAAPRATPVAYINVATIAARHPSWRLANALEGRTSTTLDFAGLDAPQSPQPVALRSAPLERDSATLPRPADGEADDTSPIGEVPGYNRPAQRLSARDVPALEDEARTRQQNTLTEFLHDVSERQEAARNDQRALLSSELEDEIEAAQRLSIAGLQPILPPPEVQLEMTNLRLIIMLAQQERSTLLVQKVSAVSDAERDAAIARLRALEMEWREKLRAQENARLEELKKLQFEMPERMRREGQAKVQQQLQTLVQQDAVLRTTVTDALRERITAGFSTEETERFSIFLPPADLAPQRIEGGPATGTAGALALVRNGGVLPGINNQIHNGIISTNVAIRTSKGAFAGGGVPRSASPVPPARAVTTAPQAQNRAQLLRRQAWQEAERWAQAIARRQGWKLQTRRAQGTPDRTKEALRLLNLL